MTEMFSNIPTIPKTNGGPIMCPKCTSPMRLYGTEPHPRLSRTDLHTYVCASCDSAEVVASPIFAAR